MQRSGSSSQLVSLPPTPSLIGVFPPTHLQPLLQEVKSSEHTPNPQQDKNEETDQEKRDADCCTACVRPSESGQHSKGTPDTTPPSDRNGTCWLGNWQGRDTQRHTHPMICSAPPGALVLRVGVTHSTTICCSKTRPETSGVTRTT